MDRSRENLKVLINQLTSLQGDYAKSTGATLKDQSQDGQLLRELGAGLGALHKISHTGKAPLQPIPAGSTGNYVDNWLNLAIKELNDFNKHGSHYVTSCSEALLKVHGVTNIWHGNPANRKRIYFRGEHHYGYPLVSRLGRNKSAAQSNTPTGATNFELQLLSNFQAQVLRDDALRSDVFGAQEPLNKDHPDWWAIMQHFDQSFGTRMLDVTSSIFCALYFACAGWNGDVDVDKDGCLYVFPQLSVRGATPNPNMINGKLNDTNDRQMNSAQSYFTIEGSLETARFRKTSHRNDREVAQDGYFVWQPKFWEPMQLGQSFTIRVARDSKMDILRELYSIGYTADRIVRGAAGRAAQVNLAKTLSLPGPEADYY